MSTNIDTLAVNTIRTLSIDAVNAANSGHPGLPMGAAPMTYALWANHLQHNPANSSLTEIVLSYQPVMAQAYCIACCI